MGAGGWKAGGWTGNFAGNAESCALHGVVGGTLNVVEGGSFKDGFLSAAVGDACSGMVNAIEKDNYSQTAIMERAAAAGVIGGTAAVITGGNFMDGAKTAAFAQMFNDEAIEHRNTVIAKQGHTALQFGSFQIDVYSTSTAEEGDSNVEEIIDPKNGNPLSTVYKDGVLTTSFGMDGSATQGIDIHGSGFS